MSNISKDFVTKNGIVLKGTSLVTGLTSQTNALQVDSGAAIAKNLIVGSTATIYGVVTVENTAASTSTATGALIIKGGVGIGGDLNVAGTVFGVITGVISTASNVAGGTAGQVLYQTGAGATSFFGPGTAGQILVSAGASAPTYTNTSSIYVNRSVLADNDSGGATGGLRYQTEVNSSTFLSIGTAGQVLTVNSGATAPQWSNTSTFYAGFANQSNNVLGGTAGQLVYQSTTGTTAFAGPGTAGEVLTSNGTNAPSYVTTTSLYVGRALVADSATGGAGTANNISGGVLGQIPYQLGPSSTAFIGTGTEGSLLQMGANTASFISTTSVQVGFAENLLGGAAGSLPYQSAANDTAMLALSGTLGSLLTAGASAPAYITQVTARNGTGNLTTASGQSLVVGNGGLGVIGDSYFADNVYIKKALTVEGATTFEDTVTFNGTATFVFSTNTFYTDNIINIHTPPGGVANTWTSNDGKDIGLVLHNFQDGYDNNSFLGWKNSSGYLEWWDKGIHTLGGVFTGTEYGIFKTGGILLENTTGVHDATSGALQVKGGVGIAGGLFVGGTLTATSFAGTLSGTAALATDIAGGTAGQLLYQNAVNDTAFAGPGTAGQILLSNGSSGPVYTNTASVYVNSAVNAQTLFGGTAGQLVYQSTTGTTAFAGPGTAGEVLTSGGTGAPTYVSTTTLYVNRAVIADSAAGGSGSVATERNATNATFFVTFVDSNNAAATPETVYTTSTVAVNPATGVVQAHTFLGTATTATNLAAGTAGQLPYQSAPGVTAFAGPGTAGQVLTSGGSGAPTYVNTTTLYVGRAVAADSASGTSNQANNLNGGLLGQIPYQVSPNNTAFIGTGTNGSILQMGANTATFVVTASIYVNSSVNTEKIFGGTAGQLVYQSAAGTTAFAGPGTAGQILLSNGTSGPVYTNTSSVYVNSAVNAQTLFGGTAGQLHYQSATGVTAFAGPGTAGQILLSNGTSGPVYTNTSSVYVNSAVNAQTIFGGTAGQLVYQSAAGATTFAGPGTAGQILVSNGTSGPVYTNTSSIYVNRAVLADSATSSGAATSLSGGALGQIPYQLAAGSTAFIGTGTVGSLLQMGASTATFVATATIYVNRAVIADNDSGGSAGSLRYQSGANASTFLSIGTAGQMLRVNSGATAPEWVNTSSVYAAAAVSSQNLFGGTTGQLVYQSAAGTTAFAGPGTAGQLLVSAGASAPTYTNTSSIYVNSAVNAQTLYGGTAGQLHYQSAANTTAFAGPGTTGQILISGGTGAPNYQSTLTVDANVVNVNSTVASVSTTTGALVVDGGVGVAGSVYVGNRVGFVNASNVSAVYQIYNTVTNSLDTVFA